MNSFVPVGRCLFILFIQCDHIVIISPQQLQKRLSSHTLLCFRGNYGPFCMKTWVMTSILNHHNRKMLVIWWKAKMRRNVWRNICGAGLVLNMQDHIPNSFCARWHCYKDNQEQGPEAHLSVPSLFTMHQPENLYKLLIMSRSNMEVN